MRDALLVKCPRCGKPYLGYKCPTCIDAWDDPTNPLSEIFGGAFGDIFKGSDKK